MKRKIRRELTEDIPNSKARVDLVELVANEPEIFLHAGNIGVGEVGSIKLTPFFSNQPGIEALPVSLTGVLSASVSRT